MSSLKEYPTVALVNDTLAVVTIGNEEQSWRLDPGAAIADPSQLSPADYSLVTNNRHWQLVSSVATGGGGGGGGDITPLVIGQSYVTVVFSVVQPNPNWEFTELQVVNTVDPAPLNIWPGILTAKSTTGFTLQLNGLPDTGNYHLHWSFTGSGSGSGPAATTYLFSGPTTGAVGVPKTFTVQLPSGTSVASPVTVTPSDIGGGGAFSPPSVILTTASPSAIFTYTPGTVGMKTLAVTNSGGLTDPTNIAFNATLFSTTYSLIGPNGGFLGVPSTNFMVALPVGGTLGAPVTITPNDTSLGGGGGTFTPASVTLSTGSPSATFTYTPITYGPHAIATTNSGGLTDPVLTHGYISAASTYTLTGPASGVVSIPSTNFTVALPVGGYINGSATITPNDGGGGGTFTPGTVILTTAAPSSMFTYTPGTTGAKTIGVTNTGALTNPAPLTYTVSAGGLADGDPVSTWPDSSGNGHDATQSGSARPTFKTAILNGKPVVRFVAANSSGMNLASVISGATPYTCFVVMKATSPGVNLSALTSNGPSGAPLAPSEVQDGNTYIGDHFGSASDTSGTLAGGFHVITGIMNAGAATLHKDGTVLGGLTTGAGSTTGDFNQIGSRSAIPLYGDGDIAEIIFYNVVVGSPDVANIEKYLGTKWGITVGAGTAVDPSTVTGLTAWWKADSLG